MDNEFENWIDSVNHNYWLCYKYPWLIPLDNRWTSEEVEGFDYSWTKLDAMPDGWRKAFGEQMCHEIQETLEETKDKEFKYEILQIKEKWGYLHWYDNGAPKDIYDKLQAVIKKYEDLSKKTCIECGAPATKISTRWISPWCDECAKKLIRAGDLIPIDEWFKQQEDPFEEGKWVYVSIR